jgi:hypothetical protein
MVLQTLVSRISKNTDNFLFLKSFLNYTSISYTSPKLKKKRVLGSTKDPGKQSGFLFYKVIADDCHNAHLCSFVRISCFIALLRDGEQPFMGLVYGGLLCSHTQWGGQSFSGVSPSLSAMLTSAPCSNRYFATASCSQTVA